MAGPLVLDGDGHPGHRHPTFRNGSPQTPAVGSLLNPHGFSHGHRSPQSGARFSMIPAFVDHQLKILGRLPSNIIKFYYHI